MPQLSYGGGGEVRGDPENGEDVGETVGVAGVVGVGVVVGGWSAA